MANYYIADLHFAHENIIQYDKRPFADADEMTRVLTENWNRAVTDSDIVYILGDFCMAKEAEWPAYLQPLAGKKVLIRGNHDLKQPGPAVKKLFLDVKEYLELTGSGKHLILSHYPIPFHKADGNPDCWMLYGHVHNTREYDFMVKLRREIKEQCTERGHCAGNWINIGCMMPWMDYTPRTLDEIIEREKAFL